MARWRLTAAHYLNVPGTEVEFKETNRETGKQARKVYPVPAHLDPDYPPDQNYPGEIIVAHEGKSQGRDIIFVGPPTPDMEPLDEEAKAISTSLAATWKHPIESLPANGEDYGSKLMAMFEKQIREAGQVPNASTAGIDPSAFAELQKQVQELANQNLALQAQLAKKPSERRV